MRQYMDRNGQLEDGRTVKVISDAGDTKAAIYRRLGAAGQLLGNNLIVKRQEDVVFSLEEGRRSTPHRRGRHR